MEGAQAVMYLGTEVVVRQGLEGGGGGDGAGGAGARGGCGSPI